MPKSSIMTIGSMEKAVVQIDTIRAIVYFFLLALFALPMPIKDNINPIIPHGTNIIPAQPSMSAIMDSVSVPGVSFF